MEGRERERELLGRGGQEAALLVEREDLTAGAQVDRDGARLVASDAWDGQGLRQTCLERRSALCRSRGQEGDGKGEYGPGAWACPPAKMGRPAHAPRDVGTHNRLRPLQVIP